MKRPQKSWGDHEASIGGDFWASYSDLMAGLLMVFILMTSIAEIAISRSHEELRDLLTEKTDELESWNHALQELCSDPDLRSSGVTVDCDTGAISLPDKVLFGFNSATLQDDGKKLLRTAIPKIFSRLEADPRFWERIDKIEIRGHADPIANSADPYGTNLEKSQERAFTVLKFLTEDSEVPPSYRLNLHDRAVAAGAADARPPRSCPHRTKACFEVWRRVEIHIDFRDSDYRQELNEVLNRVLDMVGRRE